MSIGYYAKVGRLSQSSPISYRGQLYEFRSSSFCSYFTLESGLSPSASQRPFIKVIVKTSSALNSSSLTYKAAAPVAHCQALIYISGSFLMLSQASTSLLFFVRVKAVYSNSKIVTGFFGVAWFVNFGLSVLVPLAMDGEVSPIVSLDSHINILTSPSFICI